MKKADAALIRFEPVEHRHLPLLDRWLHAPHMREWWGEPEEELAMIRDMIEGRDTSRPFLIVLEGEPVGYIQYWYVGHHQNESWLEKAPWLRELPADTVGVDLSIGDPAKLSQGIGSRALKAFAEKLVADGHESIIVDPDPANLRAVRAYTKAGFRQVPHLVGRTGNSLIMQFKSSARETTR